MTGSLLDDALRRAHDPDGGRPFVTYYDDRTGERVELSVTTLANWVAKTANLVVDGLGLVAGDAVRLDLPRHWQLPIWALAAWTAGLTVDLDGDPARAQLAVCGPDSVDAARSAPDVVALSLRPMGAPFPDGALPPGVLDYGVEVAGYGDRFTGPSLDPARAALRWGAGAWTLDEAFGQARAMGDSWGLGVGGRLLVANPLSAVTEVLASTLVPLALAGSVVLCAPAGGDLDPGVLAERAASERTTAVARSCGPARPTSGWAGWEPEGRLGRHPLGAPPGPGWANVADERGRRRPQNARLGAPARNA